MDPVAQQLEQVSYATRWQGEHLYVSAALDINSYQQVQLHLLERGPTRDLDQTLRTEARPALAVHMSVSLAVIDALVDHVAQQCSIIADLEILNRKV